MKFSGDVRVRGYGYEGKFQEVRENPGLIFFGFWPSAIPVNRFEL